VGNADIDRFFFSFIYSENVQLWPANLTSSDIASFTTPFSLPLSFCSYSLCQRCDAQVRKKKRCDAHENNSDSSSICVSTWNRSSHIWMKTVLMSSTSRVPTLNPVHFWMKTVVMSSTKCVWTWNPSSTFWDERQCHRCTLGHVELFLLFILSLILVRLHFLTMLIRKYYNLSLRTDRKLAKHKGPTPLPWPAREWKPNRPPVPSNGNKQMDRSRLLGDQAVPSRLCSVNHIIWLFLETFSINGLHENIF
jgi:hypothetical protein